MSARARARERQRDRERSTTNFDHDLEAGGGAEEERRVDGSIFVEAIQALERVCNGAHVDAVCVELAARHEHGVPRLGLPQRIHESRCRRLLEIVDTHVRR